MKQRTLVEIGCSLDLPERLPNRAFQKVATDCRDAGPGDIFCALTGAKTDGHLFLGEAAAKGAIAAIVAERYCGPDYGLVLIKVPDVLAAMQKAAKKRIAAWNPPIVAVTGSVGKTTTKEFISTLLASRFEVGKSPGNANSQVGLAVAVLNLSGNEEVLVLEMGMTEAGNIANLITIAPPTVSVITKIGMAHAGNFTNGIEGVASAKAEILAHPQTKLAVIGADANRFEAVGTTGSCKKVTAGCAPNKADFALFAEGDSWKVCEKNGMSPLLQLPFTMTHFLEDFAIAAAVARSMGLWWEEIIPVLPSLQSTGNRFAQVKIDGALFINDAYNAGPESVRAALDNLPIPGNKGRRIAVLGGMTVDLGPLSDALHREIARHALEKADLFFCYGPGSVPMKEVFEEAGRLCLFTENMDELKNCVFSFVRPQDVVLVKGANRYAMWELLQGKTP